MKRLVILLALWIRAILGAQLTWRDYVRAGIALPVMGGVAETLTTLDRVLKERYAPGGIVNQVNVDTFLLDKLEKARRLKNMGGRYFYKPIRLGLSGGSGFRGENSDLPAAGTFAYDDVQIPIRFGYAVLEITNQAVIMGRGDLNSFADVLELSMDGLYEEFRLLTAIAAYGWGKGIIGVIAAGGVTGSVITLADDIHPGNWFMENMKIDSYQSDESTVRQAGMKVTDVDLVNRKITVDTIGATAATDRLVFASGLNIVPHGLLAAIDGGPSTPVYVDTYMAIQRSAAGKSKWKSYVSAYNDAPAKYGNTNRRNVTPDLIQKVLDEQRVRGGASRPIDQLLSSLNVRRAYWNQLSPDRRHNSAIYDGGWKQLKFSHGDREIPWFADELHPRYTVFGLHTGSEGTDVPSEKATKIEDEEVLALYEAAEAEWDTSTGSEFKQVYGANGTFKDNIGAFFKRYYNIATCRPNLHVRIDDLNE